MTVKTLTVSGLNVAAQVLGGTGLTSSTTNGVTTLSVSGTQVSGTRFLNPTAGSYSELYVDSNDRRITLGQRSSTQSGGDLAYLYTATATPISFWTSAAERMHITAAGNVGIGTSSPGRTLEVQGNWRLGSTGTTAQSGSNYWGGFGGALNTSNNIYSVYFRDNTDVFWNSGWIEGQSLIFRTTNYKSATPVTAGNFIVGHTYEIATVGTTTTWTGIGASAATIGTIFTVSVAASGNGAAYDTRKGDAVHRMMIDNSGKVGVGTTSPNFGLHIQGTDSTALMVERTANDGTTTNTYTRGLYIRSGTAVSDWGVAGTTYSDANYTNKSWWSATGKIGFGAGGRTPNDLVIDTAGNVGIGTTSPESLLSVRKDTAGGRGGEISIVNGASATVGNDASLNFGVDPSTYSGNASNAQIKAIMTNTNGAADLVHSLWSGSAFLERMRIASSGDTTIGGNLRVGSSSTNNHISFYGVSGDNPSGYTNTFIGQRLYALVPVSAGSFVNASSYVIVTVGTTDFTLLGAAANTIGTVFTANGTGTGGVGVGTASLQTTDLSELFLFNGNDPVAPASILDRIRMLSGSYIFQGLTNYVEGTFQQVATVTTVATRLIIKENDYAVPGAVGIATDSPTSTFHANGTFAITTATSGTANSVILAAASYALPNATTCSGRMYWVKNTSTSAITMTSAGGTIDGVAAGTGVSLAQYDCYTVISDGTNWFVI